jgi:hypothetical protein
VIPLHPGDKLSVLRHRGRTPKPHLWMNPPYQLLIADPNRTNYYSSARAAPQEGGSAWIWNRCGSKCTASGPTSNAVPDARGQSGVTIRRLSANGGAPGAVV